MKDHSQEDLEARFREHGLPPGALYPWWYRTIRALGFNVKPPVIASPLSQMLCIWANLLVIMGIGAAITLWQDGRMKPVYILAAVFFTVNPLLTWLYYRSLRRRIGL